MCSCIFLCHGSRTQCHATVPADLDRVRSSLPHRPASRHEHSTGTNHLSRGHRDVPRRRAQRPNPSAVPETTKNSHERSHITTGQPAACAAAAVAWRWRRLQLVGTRSQKLLQTNVLANNCSLGLVLFMLTHAHIARFDSSLSGKLSPNWSEKGQGYPRRRRRHRHRLARRDEGALATAVAPALVATALAPSMSPPLPPPLLPSLVTPRAARAATRTRHWAGALALKLRLRSCVLQLGARDSAFAHCASRAPLYTASTTVIAIAISIPTAHGPSLTTVSHCGTRRWAVPLWHQLHCTSQLQLYPRPLAESSSRGRARSRRRAAASIIIFIR